MRRRVVFFGPIVAALLLVGACDDDESGGTIPFDFDSGGGTGAEAGRYDATPTDTGADVALADTGADAHADTDAAAAADASDGGVDASDADADAGPLEPPKTNLEVWLRADRGVTEAAGKVVTWADQSGKGHDFTQPDALKQPTRIDTDAGSQKALSFTGVEHLVADTTQLFPTNASPLTIVVVFATPTPPNQKMVFNYGQANGTHDNSNLEVGISTGNSPAGSFGVHRGSSLGTTTAGDLVTAGVYHRAIVTLAASGSAPANVLVRLDGADQVTSNGAPGAFLSAGSYNTASAPMEVGGRVDGNFTANTYAAHLASAGDAHFVGAISEVLVYKGGLAAGDLPLLETYLSTR